MLRLGQSVKHGEAIQFRIEYSEIMMKNNCTIDTKTFRFLQHTISHRELKFFGHLGSS